LKAILDRTSLPEAVDDPPPNKRFHPTPLRGPKIGPILKPGFGSTVISIYRCGAGEAQSVGRPINGIPHVAKNTSPVIV